jgi:transposase-like protein
MPITINIEKDPLYLRGLKKGLEEGIERKAKEDVINLYRELSLPPERIAKILKVSEQKVKQWLNEEGLL